MKQMHVYTVDLTKLCGSGDFRVHDAALPYPLRMLLKKLTAFLSRR